MGTKEREEQMAQEPIDETLVREVENFQAIAHKKRIFIPKKIAGKVVVNKKGNPVSMPITQRWIDVHSATRVRKFWFTFRKGTVSVSDSAKKALTHLMISEQSYRVEKFRQVLGGIVGMSNSQELIDHVML